MRSKKSCYDINDDLQTESKSYKNLQVCNFLVLIIRLNFRAGPTLALTWNDIAEFAKTAAFCHLNIKQGTITTLH